MKPLNVHSLDLSEKSKSDKEIFGESEVGMDTSD